MRAGAACQSRRAEWLPAGASPLPCSWHHVSDRGLLTLWPDEYRHWAAARGLLDDERAVPDGHVRVVRTERVTTRDRGLQIVNPPDGAVYLIDPTLRRDFQAVSLRATGTTGMVDWHVNGRLVGSSTAERHISWTLRAGDHRVVVRDRHGRSAAVTIHVK